MEIACNLREYLLYHVDAIGSEENPSKANKVKGYDTSYRFSYAIAFDSSLVRRVEEGAPNFVYRQSYTMHSPPQDKPKGCSVPQAPQ